MSVPENIRQARILNVLDSDKLSNEQKISLLSEFSYKIKNIDNLKINSILEKKDLPNKEKITLLDAEYGFNPMGRIVKEFKNSLGISNIPENIRVAKIENILNSELNNETQMSFLTNYIYKVPPLNDELNLKIKDILNNKSNLADKVISLDDAYGFKDLSKGLHKFKEMMVNTLNNFAKSFENKTTLEESADKIEKIRNKFIKTKTKDISNHM